MHVTGNSTVLWNTSLCYEKHWIEQQACVMKKNKPALWKKTSLGNEKQACAMKNKLVLWKKQACAMKKTCLGCEKQDWVRKQACGMKTSLWYENTTVLWNTSLSYEKECWAMKKNQDCAMKKNMLGLWKTSLCQETQPCCAVPKEAPGPCCRGVSTSDVPAVTLCHVALDCEVYGGRAMLLTAEWKVQELMPCCLVPKETSGAMLPRSLT